MKYPDRFIPLVFLPGLLLLTGMLLWPGVQGAFLLDDIPNLSYLAHTAPESWRERLSLAMGQISGMTRVLPGLSFVLQADAWPDHPARMIAANIVLHLANGAIVFALTRGLLAETPRRDRIALVATAIWLLSPIQVSGTLYIVQRINQMSAFFVFLGLLAYVHGRRLGAGHERSGWIWMSAGIAIGGGAAVLCKENGVLLPLLALVCEATLLRHVPWPSRGGLWRALFLFGPLVALVALMFWRFDVYVMHGYAQRDFTWQERLLTEGRILLAYLRIILLPRTSGLGLFHDDEPVARGSVEDTLFALAAIALLGAGWLLRRRAPALAFGLLWFFAGHALESTIVPLELYFEHRNYLPLFGPALALASLWSLALERARGVVRVSVLLLIPAWLTLASWATHQQARAWGNPLVLGEIALFEHPNSHRAMIFQAGLLSAQGFKDAASRLFERAGSVPAGRLRWLRAGCDGRMSAMPDIARLADDLRQFRRDAGVIAGLASLADAMEDGICPAVAPAAMLELVAALGENPAYVESRTKLDVLRGRFLMAAGRFDEAAIRFGETARGSGEVETMFLEVKALHAAGRLDEARGALERMGRAVDTGGWRTDRYRSDLARWNKQLTDSSR